MQIVLSLEIPTVVMSGIVSGAIALGITEYRLRWQQQRQKSERLRSSDTIGFISGNKSIDQNDDGLIDDAEILRAIGLWRSEEPVPGTGGKAIERPKTLGLIDAWRKETELE